MSLIAPAQGLRRFPSPTSYFQRGTTPNQILYGAGLQNQTAFSTVTPGAGVIRAVPFQMSRAAILAKLYLNVTTGAGVGGVARCGIYRATSAPNQYPSSLVVDSGELDTSAIAVLSATVSAALAPGYYWACWLGGVANAAYSIPAVGGRQVQLGSPSTIATLYNSISVAFAYAALPATFPGSAAAGTLSCPIVGMEFSS